MAFHPLSLEEALGLKGADVDETHIYVRRAIIHPKRNVMSNSVKRALKKRGGICRKCDTERDMEDA